MPVIRLSDSTFERLSQIKTWMRTKTPDETVFMLVTRAMADLGIETDDSEPDPPARLQPSEAGTRIGSQWHFSACPDCLLFTKVQQARVDSDVIVPPNWAQVLIACIRRLAKAGVTGSALQAMLQIPSKLGRYEEEGYRFFPDLGLSIQGQSASDAGAEACRLATVGGFPLELTFVWRNNERALHPGQAATLSIQPKHKRA